MRVQFSGVVAACVYVFFAAAPGVCIAQTGAAPPAADTIFARKTAMGMIDLNMDEVESMLLPEGKLETADAREHLDLISVLLQTFPHLFPAETNQWKNGAERDPALDTFASPQVWATFDDFYARAKAASQTAFSASRATKLVEFKSLVSELRSQCNGCHAVYQKPD